MLIDDIDGIDRSMKELFPKIQTLYELLGQIGLLAGKFNARLQISCQGQHGIFVAEQFYDKKKIITIRTTSKANPCGYKKFKLSVPREKGDPRGSKRATPANSIHSLDGALALLFVGNFLERTGSPNVHANHDRFYSNASGMEHLVTIFKETLFNVLVLEKDPSIGVKRYALDNYTRICENTFRVMLGPIDESGFPDTSKERANSKKSKEFLISLQRNSQIPQKILGIVSDYKGPNFTPKKIVPD